MSFKIDKSTPVLVIQPLSEESLVAAKVSNLSQPIGNQEESPQVRRVPPMSANDTMINFKSAHGTGQIFTGEELEMLPIVRRETIGHHPFAGKSIEVYYTRNQKAILQQQATRGCTAAVTAMLILDKGINPSLYHLTARNLGTTEDMKRDLEDAGLMPIVRKIQPSQFVTELGRLINKYGSAIVSIEDRELGGHVIVVDAIDNQAVRIREPYHGIELTIALQSLIDRKPYHEVVLAYKAPK